MEFEITKGKKKAPFNVLMMGVPGIGKTHWASGAPDPIFIGAEELDESDVDNLPRLTKYNDIYKQLEFVKNKNYKTLVIDTIDSLEKLLQQKILASDPKQTGSMNRAHGGYGAANDMAEKEFLKLRDKLSELRHDKGMNIILLAHTKTKSTNDPVLGATYDEFKLYLQEKSEAVFVEWVSAVLFATYVTNSKADSNGVGGKTFAYGDGQRVILTEKRPGHLAKNRYNLPFELPMPFDPNDKTISFKPFLDGYEAFYSGKKRQPKEIKENITGLIENLEDEDLKNKVINSVKQAKDNINKLETIENRLKERVGA